MDNVAGIFCFFQGKLIGSGIDLTKVVNACISRTSRARFDEIRKRYCCENHKDKTDY